MKSWLINRTMLLNKVISVLYATILKIWRRNKGICIKYKNHSKTAFVLPMQMLCPLVNLDKNLSSLQLITSGYLIVYDEISLENLLFCNIIQFQFLFEHWIFLLIFSNHCFYTVFQSRFFRCYCNFVITFLQKKCVLLYLKSIYLIQKCNLFCLI